MCTVRVSQQQPVGRPNDASPWAFAGMVGPAAVFFLFAATPTVVDPPWWALALLMLVALIQGCRCFIRRPVAVLALSIALALGWFAVVLAGARWLDRA